MTLRLHKISGVCNDVDGVFYPFDAIPNVHYIFAEAAANAIRKLLPDLMTFPQAIELAFEGYKTHGDGITAPTRLATQHGHDADLFKRSLFRDYHREALLTVRQIAPHVLMDDHALIAAFKQHNGSIKNGIATHGCSNEWARPMISAKGLTPYIQDNAIFGLGDVDFTVKHESPLLVETCFEALGTPEDERAYTEDTTKNLKIAKEHNPRLITVYIHQGTPLETLPAYIDYQFRDLPEFHAALHTDRVTSRKLILT